MLNRFTEIQKGWLICLLGSVICLSLMAYKSKMDYPDRFDSQQYIAAAHNLSKYGVYSQSMADTEEAVKSGQGREPGFPLVMSWVYDLGLGDIEQATMQCLSTNEGCGVQPYKAVQWLNRLFFALAGICLFWIACHLFHSTKYATISGASIWLNIKMQSSMDQVVSDPLAVFLVCAFSLFIVLGVQRNSLTHKLGLLVLSGLTLGALILTKAVYMYYLYAAIGISILYFILMPAGHRIARKAIMPAFIVFLCAALMPSLWIMRNGEVTGQYKLTDSREGIALSARNIFHEMTTAEFFTAFLYWTPGFGDNLARRHLPESAWKRFDTSNPKGFFLEGHNKFGEEVSQVQKEQNLSPPEATEARTRELKLEILTNPITHSLTTLPLFYRGIVRDIFIPLSLPGMLFLLYWAYRYKNTLIFVAASPGFFSLIFYPLVSLNVSRYQITAAPAFALGLVFFFIMFDQWRKKRREAKGLTVQTS